MDSHDMERVKRLAEELVSWAQNDEMIDQHYLTHGCDCTEAAALLLNLANDLEEAEMKMQAYHRFYILISEDTENANDELQRELRGIDDLMKDKNGPCHE